MIRIWQLCKIVYQLGNIRPGSEVIPIRETDNGFICEVGPWNDNGEPSLIREVPLQHLSL